ncbi:MAG: hypothetical protein ACON4U_12570 [Myxococcota bacterium]
MSTALAFFCQLAAAETSIESYAQFMVHITDEEYKAALRTADLVDEALLLQSDLIDAQTLPDFWMYRGLAYSNRRKKEQAMMAWRQGLRVDIQLLNRAEESGVFNIEQLDIIAALTQEISAQHERRLDIPSQTGQIQFFLDGRLVKAGSLSYEGRHLLQVKCPFDPFQSIWIDGLQNIDWLSYCPNGMGEAKASGIPSLGDLGGLIIPPPAIVNATPESQDVPKETETIAASDAQVSKPEESNTNNRAAPLTTTRSGSTDQVEIMIIPTNDFRDRVGMGCMIGGGVFLTAGVLTHFTAVRPRYERIEAARSNPQTVTRVQADQLTASFNSSRWTTIALLGAGAALSGSGAAVYFTASDNGIPVLGGHWRF